MNFRHVMEKDMKIQDQENKENGSNMFLTGAILLANLDYIGLADYAIKAFIGGVIWMAFRVGNDWLTEKMRERRNHRYPKKPIQ